MVDKLSGTGAAPARATESTGDLENLPVLLGRLGDEVMQLMDTKLNLLKVEVKEEADVYVRDSAMIGTGAIVAAVGFALFNVAVALLVSLLFPFSQPVNFALGFVVTGLVYMIIGGIVVVTMKNRLSKRALVPKTSVEELERDKQWLRNNI
ncbi:MAG: hypothetical protein QOH96_3533 [Blastocatellia bacterium]|jgi:uncharacterized membrane protein YqjE|nr:hypothetical protein [Blastocatellia bacterium]